MRPADSSARIRLMVTVKAYPAISRRHGEVVCVAGIRTDLAKPQWVRLWPIGFRDLPFSQRFQKYQEIEVEVRKTSKDKRPESLQPRTDTLRLGQGFSTSHGWASRKRWIEPLVVGSMCEVYEREERDGTSLAVIKPGRVDDFVMESVPAGWNPGQRAVIDQPSLFAPDKETLKQVPFRFKYHFTCDRKGCRGHEMSIIDWEIAQAYFKWGGASGVGIEAKLRAKWLDEICGPTKDTLFFVGNIHKHPKSFLVLGTFWPPREEAADQLRLGL